MSNLKERLEETKKLLAVSALPYRSTIPGDREFLMAILSNQVAIMEALEKGLKNGGSKYWHSADY